MLDIRYLRQNIDLVRKKLRQRGQAIDFDRFLTLDKERRDILLTVETLRNERNDASKEIGRLKKEKKDAAPLIAKMAEVSEKIKRLDDNLKAVEDDLNKFMLMVPNMQHESVPVGSGENDNVVVRLGGEKPVFKYEPKEHWEIGENLNILDFSRGAKIAGARFTLYKGMGAALERALVNFMLDLHVGEHGYTEVLTPFMVNRESMTGTGQLPKFAEDLFKIDGMEYYLIPTAEVPVTNIYREEVLEESNLPVYYVAYSPCFRSEAGSYGKDTRGLVRQHQFNKVEMVKFTKPEYSYDELEKLTANAEAVLDKLGIHYRTVNLCAGDLGFSSAKTYDVEAWMPGQNVYREISSCSNFEDFQARRASIRFRREDGGKIEFVHTLNGSGLAVAARW